MTTKNTSKTQNDDKPNALKSSIRNHDRDTQREANEAAQRTVDAARRREQSENLQRGETSRVTPIDFNNTKQPPVATETEAHPIVPGGTREEELLALVRHAKIAIESNAEVRQGNAALLSLMERAINRAEGKQIVAA